MPIVPGAGGRLWDAYRDAELERARQVVESAGFRLDSDQVHLAGERFLAGAWKLVLSARTASDDRPVVIKFSSDPDGVREIAREHAVRGVMDQVDLTAHGVFSPEEIYFAHDDGEAILATAYVRQDVAFERRPVDDQLSLALRALEAQESARLDLSPHAVRVLGVCDADAYLIAFAAFRVTASTFLGSGAAIAAAFDRASRFLETGSAIMRRHEGRLTHSDFAPHNVRIFGEHIYLLDHASIHIGNTYEAWGRFTNYIMLRNRSLEAALVDHVKSRRPPDEYTCFRQMRVFKAGFFVDLYANALAMTHGDLHQLCRERVVFWTCAMEAVLDDVPLPTEVIAAFVRTRDRLRGAGEHARRREVQ